MKRDVTPPAGSCEYGVDVDELLAEGAPLVASVRVLRCRKN
jgi:hypothetical protein